jgi:hypothetical protein
LSLKKSSRLELMRSLVEEKVDLKVMRLELEEEL